MFQKDSWMLQLYKGPWAATGNFLFFPVPGPRFDDDPKRKVRPEIRGGRPIWFPPPKRSGVESERAEGKRKSSKETETFDRSRSRKEGKCIAKGGKLQENECFCCFSGKGKKKCVQCILHAFLKKDLECIIESKGWGRKSPCFRRRRSIGVDRVVEMFVVAMKKCRPKKWCDLLNKRRGYWKKVL